MADQNRNNQTVTWNSGGTTFAAEKMNVTDTASAAGSFLQQWQVGSVDKWTVSKQGNFIAAGNGTISGNGTVTGTFAVGGTLGVTGISTFAGVLLGPAGAAAAPTYAFSGEPDCGMYFATANTLRWATAGVLAMTLDATGNLTAVANVTAYSDERHKKDWADLPSDFIERLAAVKMGTYTRTDNGARQVGVGAQSLQPVMPEAVISTPDDDGVEYLSVAYGNAALAACVELAREVCRLRALIEDRK